MANVEADDLGADWERWADGRAFRLKRKRDFADVDPGRLATRRRSPQSGWGRSS